MKRENQIAFACGMKGSGKSRWLLDRFVSHAPRVIHDDPNGEFLDDPNVTCVQGLPATLEALRAASYFDAWRIAVALTMKEKAELFARLAPSEGFGKNSLARGLGGVAVECGEAYLLAPINGADERITGAWMRGRHHLLSLYMGAQRCSTVNRILTSQADVVGIFAQEEALDLKRVRDEFGETCALDVAALQKWWCVEIVRGTGYYEVLDPSRRVTKRISRLTGAPVKHK